MHRGRGLRGLVPLALAIGTAAAWAQDPPLPDLRVTASRLHSSADSVQAVQVLTRRDLERSGTHTLAEFLQQQTGLQGGLGDASNVGPLTYGQSTASLKGLGSDYTLVLLNGQRLPTFGGQTASGFGAAVDLNTIPLSAIERIEVLPLGGSAVHGADAVGGVINLITRQAGPFHEARSQLSLPRGGAREWTFSASTGVGTADGQGPQWRLSAQASHRSALPAHRREFARQNVLEVHHDGQRYRLDTSRIDAIAANAPANVQQSDGSYLNPAAALNGQCPSGQRLQGQACTYDYAAELDLIAERRQASWLSQFQWQGDHGLRVEADWLLSRVMHRTRTTPAPASLYITRGTALYDTYLAPFGFTDDYPYAEARVSEWGARQSEDSSTLSHLGVRLSAPLSATWQWRGQLHHGRSLAHNRIANQTTLGALQTLVDEDRFNPFVGPGGQTPEAQAALQGINYQGTFTQGLIRQHGVSMDVQGPVGQLAGGPVRLALGGSVGQEGWRSSPSGFAQGLYLDPVAGTAITPDLADYALRLGDATALRPGQGQRRLTGLFAELSLPWRHDVLTTQALRHDQHEGTGGAWTASWAARWQASPALQWRTHWGTGFRAPTLPQRLAPVQGYGTSSTLDCDALDPVFASLGSTCPGSGTIRLLTGGNPDLHSERSRHVSAGLQWSPSAQTHVALDAWAVAVRHIVSLVDTSLALSQPQRYASRWSLTPDGFGGEQLTLLVSGDNLQQGLSNGLDLQVSHQHTTPWGRLGLRWHSSTIWRQGFKASADQGYTTVLADGQYSLPTLRHRISWQMGLSQGDWHHQLTVRWQSGYLERSQRVEQLDASGQATGQFTQIRRPISGHTTLDWTSTWSLPAQALLGGRWQLQVGLLNLLDQAPPLSLATAGDGKGFQVGYDERLFDPRGRVLLLAAVSRF